MKSSHLILLSLSLFSLAACDDSSGPREVLKSAYSAVSRDKLERFVGYLDGQALSQYGSAAGLQRAKSEYAQFSQLKLSNEQLLSREDLGASRERTKFVVTIYNDNTAIRNAYVTCLTVPVLGEICRPTPDRPHHPRNLSAAPEAFRDCTPYMTTERNCTITRLTGVR